MEPLPEIWQRDLAASELAKLIRERASDVGVPADEVEASALVLKIRLNLSVDFKPSSTSE